MLPAERGEVFEQDGIDGLASQVCGVDCSFYIDSVPEGDCGRDEGEAACPVALLLEAAVPYLSEAAEEDGPSEGVASFTFVEAGVNSAAKVDALQPGEDEERSLDAAQLAESEREAVLSRVPCSVEAYPLSCRSLVRSSGYK